MRIQATEERKTNSRNAFFRSVNYLHAYRASLITDITSHLTLQRFLSHPKLTLLLLVKPNCQARNISLVASFLQSAHFPGERYECLVEYLIQLKLENFSISKTTVLMCFLNLFRKLTQYSKVQVTVY